MRDLRKERLKLSFWALVLFLLFSLIATLTGWNEISLWLFKILLSIGCFLAVVKTFQMTADLFTEDRRNGTLGFLFLAGLRPMELFVGKLGGKALIVVYEILALAPFFAVSFVTGGVSEMLFTGGIAFLITLFLFTLSISTLSSVLTDDAAAAQALAYGLGGIFCLLPFGMHQIFEVMSEGTRMDAVLLFSPVYGGWLIFNDRLSTSALDFWANCLISLLYVFLIFLAAGRALALVWKREVFAEDLPAWQNKFNQWLHGSIAWRGRIWKEWSEKNPYVWLAASDRQPVRLCWIVTVVVLSLWMGGLFFWPKGWITTMNCYVTAMLLNCMAGLIFTYSAAKRLAIDRRSGALELFLTSPVSVDQIVEGQRQALKDQFKPVFVALGCVNGLLLVAGLLSREWNWKMLVSYLLVWGMVIMTACFYLWTRPSRAMWVGLNSARPSYAVLGPLMQISWLPLYVLWSFSRYTSLSAIWQIGFPYGTTAELVIVSFVFLVYYIIIAITADGGDTTLDTLKNEFRSVVEEPVPEPSDKRFKWWIGEGRFSRASDPGRFK